MSNSNLYFLKGFSILSVKVALNCRPVVPFPATDNFTPPETVKSDVIAPSVVQPVVLSWNIVWNPYSDNKSGLKFSDLNDIFHLYCG